MGEVEPPFTPLHAHVHGPEPETIVGLPTLQRFELGALEKFPPLEDPQTPLVILLAVHVDELEPPFAPVHVHVQGPDPEMAVGVPVLQRFELGGEE